MRNVERRCLLPPIQPHLTHKQCGSNRNTTLADPLPLMMSTVALTSIGSMCEWRNMCGQFVVCEFIFVILNVLYVLYIYFSMCMFRFSICACVNNYVCVSYNRQQEVLSLLESAKNIDEQVKQQKQKYISPNSCSNY